MKDHLAADVPLQFSHVVVALCEAAIDLLTGLGERVPRCTVPLADAADAANVVPKTAYRHINSLGLPGRPQEAFDEALRTYVISRLDNGRDRSLVVVRETWSPLFGATDLTSASGTPRATDVCNRMADMSPHQRGAVLVEMIRRGANANVAVYGDDRVFLAYLALFPTSPHSPIRSERAFQFADLYGQVATAFEFRLRPGLEWAHFVRTLSVLAEGLWFGADRRDAEWTLFTEAVLAIVRGWFVPSEPRNPYAVLPGVENLKPCCAVAETNLVASTDVSKT